MRVTVWYPTAECPFNTMAEYERVTMDDVDKYYQVVYSYEYAGSAFSNALDETFMRCNQFRTSDGLGLHSLREYIRRLVESGVLTHLSMSVGDVVILSYDEGFVCAPTSWKWITDTEPVHICRGPKTETKPIHVWKGAR